MLKLPFLIFIFLANIIPFSFAKESALLKTVKGHGKPAASADCLPDGKHITSGGSDAAVKLRKDPLEQNSIEPEQNDNLAKIKMKFHKMKVRLYEKLAGDKIRCDIPKLSAGYDYNGCINNCRAYINRKKGALTIVFDYNTPCPDYDYANHFLIKLLDQNGQNLDRFTTEELYTAKIYEYYAYKREPKSGELCSFKELLKEANIIQYRINPKDAAVINVVEFGFSTYK